MTDLERELLAVLKKITELHADFDLTCDHSVGVCCCADIAAMEAARAAIAKAEGREP